jgi:hypothetical protein
MMIISGLNDMVVQLKEGSEVEYIIERLNNIKNRGFDIKFI